MSSHVRRLSLAILTTLFAAAVPAGCESLQTPTEQSPRHRTVDKRPINEPAKTIDVECITTEAGEGHMHNNATSARQI